MSEKFTKSLIQFADAVKSLEVVLDMEETEVIRDSAIQRFEFCVDLSWKVLKRYLEEHSGILVKAPKDTMREAFKVGLIENDLYWLDMIDMRNTTSHTYDRVFAKQVYDELSKALPYFQKLRDILAAGIETA